MTTSRHANPDEASLASREPALLVTAILAVIVAGGGFFSAWGGGVDWRIALGGALAAGATSMGAGAVIRSQVTPEPNVTATVNSAISSVYAEVDTSTFPPLPEPLEVAHPGEEPD